MTILTPKRREVLRLLIQGRRVKEIAEILGLDSDTVYCRLQQARRSAYAITNEQMIYKLCQIDYFQSAEWKESFPDHANRARYTNLAYKTLVQMAALIICLFTVAAFGADVPVLKNTNMAAFFGDQIEWRSCVSWETYSMVSTSGWSQITPVFTDTNGLRSFYETRSLITNRTLKFTFEGKEYFHPLNPDRGPVIGVRQVPVPPEVRNIPVPARQRR